MTKIHCFGPPSGTEHNAFFQVLSNLGIFELAYLDDLLIATATATISAEHLQILLLVLADLGWLVN